MMRKILLLLCLLVPMCLTAQDFQFGLRGGFNLGNYQGEDNGGDYKFAGYGGALLTYYINDIWSLQTEVNYSMQGFRDHVVGESIRVDLDYVTAPLLVQFTLRNYEQFKFSLGPQVGYLVRSNEDPENLYISDDADNSDSYEDFDYGAVLGLEYEINSQFYIQARYYHGISKFFNQDLVDSDAKLRVFSLGVAYRM